MMGYIVDLTVILDGISRKAAGNMTENTENVALKVTNTHVRSGPRDSIHRDIRKFFKFGMRSSHKDLVLEKVIDLIRQYCASS